MACARGATMKHEEYFADDRLIIPEDILKMTSAQRQAEIARLEKEARAERDRLDRQARATA